MGEPRKPAIPPEVFDALGGGPDDGPDDTAAVPPEVLSALGGGADDEVSPSEPEPDMDADDAPSSPAQFGVPDALPPDGFERFLASPVGKSAYGFLAGIGEGFVGDKSGIVASMVPQVDDGTGIPRHYKSDPRAAMARSLSEETARAQAAAPVASAIGQGVGVSPYLYAASQIPGLQVAPGAGLLERLAAGGAQAMAGGAARQAVTTEAPTLPQAAEDVLRAGNESAQQSLLYGAPVEAAFAAPAMAGRAARAMAPAGLRESLGDAASEMRARATGQGRAEIKQALREGGIEDVVDTGREIERMGLHQRDVSGYPKPLKALARALPVGPRTYFENAVRAGEESGKEIGRTLDVASARSFGGRGAPVVSIPRGKAAASQMRALPPRRGMGTPELAQRTAGMADVRSWRENLPDEVTPRDLHARKVALENRIYSAKTGAPSDAMRAKLIETPLANNARAQMYEQMERAPDDINDAFVQAMRDKAVASEVERTALGPTASLMGNKPLWLSRIGGAAMGAGAGHEVAGLPGAAAGGLLGGLTAGGINTYGNDATASVLRAAENALAPPAARVAMEVSPAFSTAAGAVATSRQAALADPVYGPMISQQPPSKRDAVVADLSQTDPEFRERQRRQTPQDNGD